MAGPTTAWRSDRMPTPVRRPPARERRHYARAVLGRFVQRAYRRPVEERTLERLVAIAENAYTQPGKRFEDGIAQAMVQVLASPRFLFRVEEIESSGSAGLHPGVDEYALASDVLNLSWAELARATVLAARAIFAPIDVQRELVHRIQSAWASRAPEPGRPGC